MGESRFGDRLRELREGAGLTQKELADRSGLKVGGIRDIEQGINQYPRWDTVTSLCHALGVDCTAFTQEPADRPPAGRGRPVRAKEEMAKPKRPRGRPKKGG